MKRLLALTLAVIFLSGCSLRKSDSIADWSARTDGLMQFQQWEFNGRMSVKDLVSGEGNQASVRWRQQDTTSRIRLSGPFGVGAHELVWEPGRVSIVAPDRDKSIQYTGPKAAERFMQEQLGWSFPVQSTRYWLRGLRDPAAPSQQIFDADGELRELSQHGWQILYERFTAVDGFALPSRMVLQNSSAKVRIVISKWRLQGDVPSADARVIDTPAGSAHNSRARPAQAASL